jgi:hypothetical protein
MRRNPLARLIFAGSLALVGCPAPRLDKPTPVESKTMDTSKQIVPEAPLRGLVLVAAPRGGDVRLFPEQAAAFDLTLENRTDAAESVVAIDGNRSTPVVRAFDAATGARLFEKSGTDMSERLVPHMGAPPVTPPRTIVLAPGASESLWVNLWMYHDPLPLGAYAFQASHQAHPGQALESRRLPFEIVAARVESAALGYDSAIRMASTLAWIAAPKGGPGAPRALLRLSGSGNHAAAQQGATDLGEAPEGGRIAVSQIPADGLANWQGWVAIAGQQRVELVRHNMAQPMSRSGPIALPITDVAPVPRFPDRGHAVFLATGRGAAGPALVGVVAAASGKASPAWSVPLPESPTLTAAVAGMSGPITVFVAADDGASSRVHRLDVDEAGAVVSAAVVVRTTPNRIIALAVDQRRGAVPSLVILESNRTMFDRLALVRLPLSGAPPPIVALAPLAGWPSVTEDRVSRALRAEAVSVEVGVDGVPRAALVDEMGRLFGGRLDGTPLALLSDGGGTKALFPHVAALETGVFASVFTDQGYLFHTRGD